MQCNYFGSRRIRVDVSKIYFVCGKNLLCVFSFAGVASDSEAAGQFQKTTRVIDFFKRAPKIDRLTSSKKTAI